MQDDALMATATPREALKFSASLRLEGEREEAEIDNLVSEVFDFTINHSKFIYTIGTIIRRQKTLLEM